MLTAEKINAMTEPQRRAELIVMAETRYKTSSFRKKLADEYGAAHITVRHWALTGKMPPGVLLWLQAVNEIDRLNHRLDIVRNALNTSA